MHNASEWDVDPRLETAVRVASKRQPRFAAMILLFYFEFRPQVLSPLVQE